MLFVILSEILLYICFGLLGGTLILYSLPKALRPDIALPKPLFVAAALASGGLSFAPVLYLVAVLAKDMGLWTAFTGVLFTFEVGKAWWFTVAVALLIAALAHFNPLENDRFLSKLGLFLFVFLIAGYARASHAASLEPVYGFFAHFFHLLAVSAWGGTLLCAAWFTKSDRRWPAFLRWFSPFAAVCVLVALIAGVTTMAIDIANPLDRSPHATLIQYENGLAVNYGQALLIKHLLIIPLLLYAAFNGLYARRLYRKNHERIRPVMWARAESAVLMLIFIVTAFMGQQAPPHDVRQLLRTDGASPLFTAAYGQAPDGRLPLTFAFTPMSALFFGLGGLFLIFLCLARIRRESAGLSLAMAAGFLASAYLGVMAGLQ